MTIFIHLQLSTTDTAQVVVYLMVSLEESNKYCSVLITTISFFLNVIHSAVFYSHKKQYSLGYVCTIIQCNETGNSGNVVGELGGR